MLHILSLANCGYVNCINKAARLLGPATRFEASKLKVVFLGEEMEKHPKIIPRIYTLTHCDLTANLTLAVSDTINIDQVCHYL